MTDVLSLEGNPSCMLRQAGSMMPHCSGLQDAQQVGHGHAGIQLLCSSTASSCGGNKAVHRSHGEQLRELGLYVWRKRGSGETLRFSAVP